MPLNGFVTQTQENVDPAGEGDGNEIGKGVGVESEKCNRLLRTSHNLNDRTNVQKCAFPSTKKKVDDKIGSCGEKERSRMIEEENKKVKHILKGRKKCTTKKPQMDKICYNIECLVMERMADKDRICVSMEQAQKRINKHW